MSGPFLRTAKPGDVAGLIQRRFPKLPQLSANDVKFVEAMSAGTLTEVPHFVHSLSELSKQGTHLIFETAWLNDTPIVAKRAAGEVAESPFVLIPVHHGR